MLTINIPREVVENKDLVAVPRRLYDEFVEWQKKVKSVRTFKMTTAERKTLARARKNFSRGKYMTLEQLEHELGFGYR